MKNLSWKSNLGHAFGSDAGEWSRKFRGHR